MSDEFGSMSLKFPFDAKSDSDSLAGEATDGITTVFGLFVPIFVSLSRASDCDIGWIMGALDRIGVLFATHTVSFP